MDNVPIISKRWKITLESEVCAVCNDMQVIPMHSAPIEFVLVKLIKNDKDAVNAKLTKDDFDLITRQLQEYYFMSESADKVKYKW